MKNGIADILNSLFSAPDKALLQKGTGSVSAKGSQPSGSTFEDVLAQLASQDTATSPSLDGQGQSMTTAQITAPVVLESPAANGVSFASLTAISEVDISISEKISVTSLDQLAQAEQALVSLAVGLSKLISLFSDLQSMDPSQAQAALVSFSGGKISPEDAKSLLGELKEMVSKFEGPQNPLALSSDQQNVLLNQMLQQMLQAQQILFGVAPSSLASNPNNSSLGPRVDGNGLAQTTDVYLQMSFSETQILSFQKTDTQNSRVFIDLQTFKMSATFVQENPVIGPGQRADLSQSFQPLPGSDSLVNALNQMFSNKLSLDLPETTQPVGQDSLTAVSPQDDLNQTFKNLVQMLVQSGASQAVLTSFLNRQNDQVKTDLSQSASQISPVGNLMESLLPNVNISPALSNDSSALTSFTPINAGSNSSKGLVVDQIVVRESVEVQIQSLTVAVSDNSMDQAGVQVAAASIPTTLNSQLVDTGVIKALNEVVARLSAYSPVSLASQTSASDSTKPAISIEQLLSVINAKPLVSIPAPANSNESIIVQAAAPMDLQSAAPQTQDQMMVPFVAGNNFEPVSVSTLLPNSPSEIDQIQSSINELIAINQFIQTQAVVSSRVPDASSSSFVVETEKLNISVTRLAQIGLTQTVLSAGQGSAVVENPVLAQNLTPPPSDNARVLVNDKTSALPLNPFVMPTMGNPGPVEHTASLLVNESPFTIQIPALSAPSTPLEPSVTNIPVQSRVSVSAAAVSIEEVSVSISDVQGKISQQAQISNNGEKLVSDTVSAETFVTVAAAQTITTAVVSGEASKAAVQTPFNAQNNIDSNNQVPANNSTNILGVQPVAPEAVVPVKDGIEVSVNLNASNDLIKNNKNSNDLLIDSALVANPSMIVVNKSNDAPLNSNQAVNNKSTQKIDSFIILNQVQDQITVRASEAKAVSRLDFQLIPESLGRVTVQIALVDQAVSARIIVSNQEVKDALQHHMVELKTSLNQAGLQIDQLQVQVQGGQSNLLAQYYQYQKEGGYGSPVSYTPAPDEVKTVENTGVLGEMSVRMSLLDVLA